MIFAAVLLIPLLPIGYQTAFRKQYKDVFRIEADPHRLVDDIHMAQILPAAADLVLTLEDQDAIWFQNSICLRKHIRVAPVQALFIGIYTEAPVDDIAAVAFQRFSFGR